MTSLAMIEILDGGYFSTIQDLGRYGWGQFGVPRSGAMDEFALRAANRLVGNPDELACIEIGLGGFRFRALKNLLMAVCGKGFSLRLDGQLMSLWQSIAVQSGQIVQVDHEGGGMWAVIAFHGGIDVKPLMGSRSTSLVGGFGGGFGRFLMKGDQLKIGEPVKGQEGIRDRSFSIEAIQYYQPDPVIRVVVGPHSSWFNQDVYNSFFQKTYVISSSSNRSGYRLQGEPLTVNFSGNLISLGMLPGAIQIPPNGEPIVMMADSPTSGGYPIIGVVIRADLPLLAQCEPLRSQIQFCSVSPEQAREAYMVLSRRLEFLDTDPYNSELWERAGSIQ